MITGQQKSAMNQLEKLFDDMADHIHSIARHAASDQDYNMTNEDLIQLTNEVWSELINGKEDVIALLKGGMPEKTLV